jgi:drug/metabolite transporter (DMT)-like permease
MFIPANLFGIFFALASALSWGGGDFSGGFATRRSNQFHVLAVSSLSGIVILVVCTLIWHEAIPSTSSLIWAAAAGVVGAVGLASLYRALSLDSAATVASTSGVIGAALPVVFSALVDGMPGIPRLVGFLLTFLGIWLVSRSVGADTSISRRGFFLACLAGVCFGGFFILIAQVNSGEVFLPLIVSRFVSFCVALLFIWFNRLSLPSIKSNPVTLLAGVLDALGNVFFLLAVQFTRLDIAVVLSSLYPAFTVLLSFFILKEKISRSQRVGVVVCLAAIVLITI